ncbi:MAG: hypothetical protein WCA78_01400 [Rhizomicrobium sp.]
MAKGFGIAALVLAILSMFSPYGINFAAIWLAMICATVAVFSGDRGLSIAATVIAIAGMLIFSPLTLAAIMAGANHSDDAGIVVVGVVPFAFPIFALAMVYVRDAFRPSKD